jgi:tetratricopeptide (TPR) repeat protein
VWRRSSALVFARRSSAHAAVIAAHEIPLTVELGGGARPLWTPPARSPVPRCQWDRRLADALAGDGEAERALDARFDALERGCLDRDEEAEVRFYRGARRQRAGDLVGAAADYDRVLVRRPDDARALVNRGFARLRSDPAAARADLERARSLAPERAAEIAQALALIDGTGGGR